MMLGDKKKEIILLKPNKNQRKEEVRKEKSIIELYTETEVWKKKK